MTERRFHWRLAFMPSHRKRACYFGDEKRDRQKLAGLIKDVTDRDVSCETISRFRSRMLPSSSVTPAFIDIVPGLGRVSPGGFEISC